MNCTNFNNAGSSSINNWNVSNVGSYGSSGQGIFAGCTKFNQPLGNWNVSNTSIFLNMFNGAVIFNNGFASGVANQLPWNTSSATNMISMFQNCTAFNSNLGTGTTPWDVSKVTDFSNMFRSASNFNNGDNSAPINNWNINTVSSVSMASMFFASSAFNRNISSWNVIKVNNFGGMFQNTNSFNNGYASGIANQLPWNTSSCTTMSSMFSGATAFNSNLGTGTTPWDVSKVTTFANMFNGASNFNNGDDAAPINNWNINTISGVSMASMFYSASAFNQPIESWNVSNVNNMGYMFANATIFNQPIGAWDVSNVTNMYGLFAQARAFNQNIGSWNTSACTSMGYMFQCAFTAGGQFNNGGSTSISTWNVSNVLDMGGMFWSQPSFNQPIGSWDVGNVTDMSYMFDSAYLFNQPIGSWNVSKVTNFANFMNGKTPATYSSANLDAIYNGWIVNGVQPNININFGSAKYTAAGKPGKDTLTSPVISGGYNWTITDGLLTVSGTSNNGGLIRVTTTAAHGFITGNSVYIYGVNGTTNANGTWIVTVVNTTVIELQGSTYNAAWTSGGNVILG